MLGRIDFMSQEIEMGRVKSAAERDTSEDTVCFEVSRLPLPTPMSLAASNAFWKTRAAEARTVPLTSAGTYIMINGRVSRQREVACHSPQQV
jgi:hypothetical protein